MARRRQTRERATMAPRVASAPSGGGRVRRVSFLIDLAGESRTDRARVRLLVRRLLAHLSRQRPSPPRWSFRFYDSGLSPHAFDARLQARADAAARRAEADAGAFARVRSWVDDAVRETAGVGSKRATGSEPNRAGSKASVPTRREFHACAPDAVAAFVDHYDETVALYHHREGDAFSEGGGFPDDRDEHERADPSGDAVDEASWFTTLARQMAAAIHDAADLAGAVGGAGGADDHPDGHSLVLVIAKTPHGGAPPVAPGHPDDPPLARPRLGVLPASDDPDPLRAFRGIEVAFRKEAARAHLLTLGDPPHDATWRKLVELFGRFHGCVLPAGAVAHTVARAAPPCATMDAVAAAAAASSAAATVASGGGSASGGRRALDTTADAGRDADAATVIAARVWVRGAGDGGRGAYLGSVGMLAASDPDDAGSNPDRVVARATIVVAALVADNQLAGGWTNVAGARGAGDDGRAGRVLAPKVGSGAAALATLLALRGAAALVEVTEERVETQERAGGEGIVSETRTGGRTVAAGTVAAADDDELDVEMDVMATQETSPSARFDRAETTTFTATLRAIAPGAMFLEPLAVASARAAAPLTPTPAPTSGARSDDVAIFSEDARRMDWGLLEPFVGDDDDETHDGVGLDAIVGEDADGPGSGPGPGYPGPGYPGPGYPESESESVVALASALFDAAASAPRGTHRWERWFGDAPRATGRFGDALVALADRRRGRIGADADADADAKTKTKTKSKSKSKSGGRSSGADALEDDPVGGVPRLPAPNAPKEDDSELASRFAAMVAGVPRDASAGANGVAGARDDVDDASESSDGSALSDEGDLFDACADADATRAAAETAYGDALADIFDVPAEDPDPDLGAAAESLATRASAAFRRVSRRSGRDDEKAEAAIAAAAAEETERALCKRAKDLQREHRAGGCKAAKRREHVLQAHARVACAALRVAAAGGDEAAALTKARMTKIAKATAKALLGVTFLLTPVGEAGLRALVEEAFAPRYAATMPRLMARIKAELGVGGGDGEAGAAGDRVDDAAGAGVEGESAPAAGGKTKDIFSPIAQPRRAGGAFADDARGDVPDASDRVGGGSRARRRGGKPAAAAATTAATAAAAEPKGWHPVFRSQAVTRRREVRVNNPAPAPFRALALPAASNASSDAALGGRTHMPAPRRLAAEFGGHTPQSAGQMTPARANAIAAMATPAPARRPATRPHNQLAGLETPAAAARFATPRRAGGGRTATTVVAATPAPTRRGGGGGGGGGGGDVPEEVVMETPFGGPAVVAETPAPRRGGPGGSRGAMAVAAAARNVARGGGGRGRGGGGGGGMASFGQMVREGREAAALERGPAKRARR